MDHLPRIYSPRSVTRPEDNQSNQLLTALANTSNGSPQPNPLATALANALVDRLLATPGMNTGKTVDKPQTTKPVHNSDHPEPSRAIPVIPADTQPAKIMGH